MSDAEKRPVEPDLKWETDLSAPFIWLEWKMECIVYVLSKLAFFKILEYAAKLTILISLIIYFLQGEARERQAEQRKVQAEQMQLQAELNAWQVVNSAVEQKGGTSSRVKALEYLNKTGVDLSLLSVPSAHLPGIKLPNAILISADFSKSTIIESNFSKANLEKANLSGASLWKANLSKANLSGATLNSAILPRANLQGAYFKEAKFTGAYFMGAKSITSEQLCKAKTLYEAQLDSGLQEKVKKECPELLKGPRPKLGK